MVSLPIKIGIAFYQRICRLRVLNIDGHFLLGTSRNLGNPWQQTFVHTYTNITD